MQRAAHAHPRQGLFLAILAAARHQARHLALGQDQLLASELPQVNVAVECERRKEGKKIKEKSAQAQKPSQSLSICSLLRLRCGEANQRATAIAKKKKKKASTLTNAPNLVSSGTSVKAHGGSKLLAQTQKSAKTWSVNNVRRARPDRELLRCSGQVLEDNRAAGHLGKRFAPSLLSVAAFVNPSSLLVDGWSEVTRAMRA